MLTDQEKESRILEKYNINIKFWEELSPDLAYILGFIAGDGCFKIFGKQKLIQFPSIDIEILEKIKIMAGLNHKIYCQKPKKESCKPLYILTIKNRTICNLLQNKWNIHPRKTWNQGDYSYVLPYFRDFLRGFLDTDGCIGVYKFKGEKSTPKINCYFSGVDGVFIKWIYNTIIKETNLKGVFYRYPKIKNKSLNYSINFRGIKAYKLLQYIYYDSEDKILSLKRKRDIFENYQTKEDNNAWTLRYKGTSKQAVLGLLS